MHTLEEIYQNVRWIGPDVVSVVTVTNVYVTNIYSAAVARTGRTTSANPGDDGDLQKGFPWPNPRFTVDTAASNVTDNLTGLMWTRYADIHGPQAWGDAIASCSNMAWGGYSDWRLPNMNELLSLVHWEYSGPCVPDITGTNKWTPGNPFYNVQSVRYWSSTRHGGNAWSVDMANGFVSSDGLSYGDRVWPVRGGP